MMNGGKWRFSRVSGCLKHSSVIVRFCVSKIVAIQFYHRQNTTPQALICLAKSHLGCLILMRKSALQRLSALVENLWFSTGLPRFERKLKSRNDTGFYFRNSCKTGRCECIWRRSSTEIEDITNRKATISSNAQRRNVPQMPVLQGFLSGCLKQLSQQKKPPQRRFFHIHSPNH